MVIDTVAAASALSWPAVHRGAEAPAPAQGDASCRRFLSPDRRSTLSTAQLICSGCSAGSSTSTCRFAASV